MPNTLLTERCRGYSGILNEKGSAASQLKPTICAEVRRRHFKMSRQPVAASAMESNPIKRDPPLLRQGMESLYFPVKAPDNSDQVLQFQWMRPHPLTFLAMSDAVIDNASSTPVASQASRYVAKQFPQYQNAVLEKNNLLVPLSSSMDVSTSQALSPFCQVLDVGIDLSELIDPPLLSPSVPLFLDEVVVEEPSKKSCFKPANLESSYPMTTIQESLDNLATATFLELTSNHANITTEVNLRSLSTLTASELQSFLPSHVFHNFLNQQFVKCTEHDAKRSAPEFFVLSLVLFAEFGASQTLGRHILQMIAPPVLADCNELVNNPEFSDIGLRLFQRLAAALLDNCELGTLHKHELLDLLQDDLDNMNGASDAIRELFCCLGEAYCAQQKT